MASVVFANFATTTLSAIFPQPSLLSLTSLYGTIVHKFHNAINADRPSRYLINENISQMHIFEC